EPECQCYPQRAADPEHLGRARDRLQRPARRLHRQHAEHLHAQQQRCRKLLRGHQAGRQRPLPQRAGDDLGILCPGEQHGRQQLRDRAQRIQSGRLWRHSRLGSLADQRRLECLDHAELPEHGSGRRVHAIPGRSDGQKLGPWQDTAFVAAYDKDRFENTAWTLNGKLGDLKAVYTGGYLDRHIDQTNDYSNYTRSAYGFYYTCSGGPGGGGFGAGGSRGAGVPAGGTPPICYSPITSWRDQVTNTHQSHELRLSTPDDWRTRGIFGAYWEDFEIADRQDFLYKTIPSCTPANLAVAVAGGYPCVANVGPPPGTTATDPSVRNDNTAYGEDVHRGYKQTAFFASFDYDLIPKVLTVTGGTRFYHYTEFEVGSKYQTNTSCTNVPNGCYTDAHSIDAEHEDKGYHGF